MKACWLDQPSKSVWQLAKGVQNTLLTCEAVIQEQKGLLETLYSASGPYTQCTTYAHMGRSPFSTVSRSFFLRTSEAKLFGVVCSIDQRRYGRLNLSFECQRRQFYSRWDSNITVNRPKEPENKEKAYFLTIGGRQRPNQRDNSRDKSCVEHI